MTSLWVALALIGQPSAPDLPNAEQFLRLLKGIHSEIHDITLVYEGGSGLIRGGAVALDGTYQGLYSFRADGATLLDTFAGSNEGNKPVLRTIHAILKGSMEATSQVPDLGLLQPERRKAIPGVLNMPTSPERILYYWYFMTLSDPTGLGYECQGWEEIDGHRCLRVQLDQVPRALSNGAKAPFVRFWIDMTRGGHPLQVEYHDTKSLVMRTTIRLKEFPTLKKGPVWLPASGETDSYGFHGKELKVDHSSSPVYRETFAVVDGSVKINEDLKDAYFSIKTNRTLPEVGGLRKYQREMPIPPPLRTDPAGVKQRLDRKLAEADRQSEQLLASSPAREFWSASLVVQAILIALGVMAIGGAVWWKWRAG